jgi:8-oxo-dGTP pyrophosphatase MutT (NUDIX family)
MPSESASKSRSPTISNDDARKLAVQDPTLYNAGLDAVRGISPEKLRTRFKEDRPWRHEMLGDGQFAGLQLPEGHVYKRAAVLVPLVVRDSLALLLTQRPLHLKHHPGQISFPGGRVEETDADAVATALRETEEEVGLARQHIEILGTLPAYHTVSNYAVTPVVALVQPPFELRLDANEVADAFEVPLDFILDPAHHEKRSRPWEGRERQFYAMPYGERFIWGATAAMLRNLYHFLRA